MTYLADKHQTAAERRVVRAESPRAALRYPPNVITQ